MGVMRFHSGKFILYSVLSLADLVLTFFLLTRGGGHIYESNPIANAWLSSFGWCGLIVYKALTMGVLAGTLFFLSMYRTQLAGRVLVFACLALSLVVGYSANIAYALQAKKGHLNSMDDLESYRAYYFSEIAPATRLVQSGIWTLAEAADHLVVSENEYWQTLLRHRYPGLSDREGLEAFLKECIGTSPKPRVHTTRVSHRLPRSIDS